MKELPIKQDSVICVTISGQGRTGKDCFANGLEAILKENNRISTYILPLAEILKAKCADIFDIPEYIFHDGKTKDRPFKDKQDPALHTSDLGFLNAADSAWLQANTPRHLIIKLGSLLESLREDGNTLCHLWWHTNEIILREYTKGKLPVVIVPDVRLPREARYFKENFPRRYSISLNYPSGKIVSTSSDKTETQVRNIPADYFDIKINPSKVEFSQDHPSVIKVFKEIEDQLL